ncbi:MAG: beta strand repeat-containing protein, partial [Roseimicrobium sp.]
MKFPQLLLGAALLASTFLSTTPQANAAPVYWDVNGTTAGSGAIDGSTITWNTDPLWNTAAGGTGSTAAWISGDTAVFAAGTDATGTYTISVSGTQEVSGLTFEEGAFTLSGGTLGISTATGGTANINVAAGLIATINSILAGNPSGTTVLTKTGAGTLVLGGANTFGGTGKRLAIQEGVLSFSSNGNLGNTANALDLGTSTTTATLRYTGATASISRLIALGAPAASSVGNVIEITNAGTVLTLSGIISGGPGNSTQASPGVNTVLTVRGAGTLDLSGANTFTGDIVIDGATYNVNALTDWGGATVASSTSHTISLINGGRMAITTTTAVNPGSITTTTHNLLQIGTGGGTVDVIASGTLQLDDAGQFFGSGVLTKTGAGTLWLGNTFTNYTGGQVNLNGGILQLQNSQALGATGSQAAITMAGTTTLNLRTTGDTNFGSNVTLTGNVTIAPGRSTSSTTSITHTLGTLTMGANTLTISLGANLSTNAVGNLTFGATTFTGNAVLQLDNVQGTGLGVTTLGAINGGAVARTITKQGLGSLTLAADATSLVAGSEFIIKSGILRINTGGALGSAAIQLGDTSGALAANLHLGAGGITVANAITVNSGSTGVMTIGGIFGSGTSIFSGNISLGNNLILTSATGGTVRFDGIISEFGGARSINKTGAGAVELTGSNTFSGPITVTAGTLSFTSVGNVGAGASALGAPTTTADGTIALAGGRLRYNGTAAGGHSTDRNFTMSVSSTIEASGVGALTLTGTLTAADGSLTLDGTGVGNLNNTTLWTAGPGDDFNKSGTGTWNINGATSAPDDWNINEGVINANVTDSLNATDDVIIDGTGIADSAIVNLNAADVFSGAEFYIRNGGRVNVDADNAFSGTDVNQLLIGDTASTGTGAATLNFASNRTISLGATGLQLGATGGHTGNIIGTGTITSTGTFSLRNGSIGSGVTLAGAGGITKVGNGVVTFSGTRTATGATTIQEGELILDYTSNNNSKIGGALTLGLTNPNVVGGGKLTMNGVASGATTETMTGTTILAGASEVALNAGTGGSVTLNLGALTRTSVGGTVAFTYGTTNAVVNSTTLNTFLGYATLTTGGTTRLAATDASGNIVQAATAAKSDIGTWVGTDNVVSTGAFTGQVGNRASIINSLAFDAPSSSITSLPNRRLTISSGAILVNATVGASNTVISGGQIVGSATAPLGELIIHQNNTLGSLEIASNIVNSAGITKSGLGELILSGFNNFAATSTLAINEGTVTLRGGNAIGDTTIVHLKQGATLAIGDGDTETVGRLGVDTNNPSNGTIALGNGSGLNINQGATNSIFAGVFTGGANTTITKTGNGNLQLTGSSSGFNGTVAVNGGLLYVAGASGRLSGATEIIVNKGGSFMIDNNDDNAPNDRISNTAAITLHSADGAWSGETRPKGLMIRTDNNGDETESVGVLTIASGSNYATLEGTATGTNISIASIIASNFVRNAGTTISVRGINLGS